MPTVTCRAVRGALIEVRRHGLDARRLALANSGNTDGNKARVVGYKRRSARRKVVAGQVGKHRFGSRERRLGIGHPALLPDGSKVAQKGPAFG